MSEKPLAFAIMGPTASGKTAAALEVALKFPVEIISVDSALVYKDMNVGTAKPSLKEREKVPHHLIDIIDPTQTYSASQFTQDATQLIFDIHARNKIPLLVGGTMMYFNSLRVGLDDLPQANPLIREKLELEAKAFGWPALHDRLKQLDEKTALRIKPTDAQRIQRALEIIELTKKPLSELHSGRKNKELPFQLSCISLEPSDRSVLHERIAARFDQMLLNDALIHEVKALQDRGDLNLSMPSMRCVGYRQTWQYLQGEFDKKALREKGIAATRQLAKRQLTWLRAIDDRIIIDCLSKSATHEVLKTIQQSLNV